MMKRFGVQLAGSGIVILLGALGVAQAQRESREKTTSAWEHPSTPALTPPPAPIAAYESADESAEGPADDFSHDGSAGDGPGLLALGAMSMPRSDSPSNPVRTVAHEEPIPHAADGSQSPDPAAFAMPGIPNDASSSPPVGVTMTLPAWSMPVESADASHDAPMPADDAPPGSGITQPMAASDHAAEAPPTGAGFTPDYAALPTLQFDAAPSSRLRNANPTPQDTYAAPAEYPPSQPMSIAAIPVSPNPNLQPLPVDYAAPTPQTAMDATATARPLPSSIDETVLAEPGDRRLEGMQSPSIIIHKRAPEEVKVGKPATFIINVHNAGGVEALDVRVHDRIPVGTRLVDASPSPVMQGDLLTWELGAIEPGGERTITTQLIPEVEGELGSVARVTFEAAASVRTISTRPQLKITQRAPEQVLIGQQLEIELEVSNSGSGVATGVVMQEDVPDGLEHPKGKQLDNVIGQLGPGEVRRQVLRLRAVAPGQIENRIRLTGDDGLVAEDAVLVDVIAPQLAVELEGPSRRFLERQAVFNVNLANVGTAEATNVEVVAYLDRGFSFVGTEYQGQYDPNRHAVYWSLAQLPPQGRGSVVLKLLPIEQGERTIRLEAKGDLNTIAQAEKIVTVDTLAELTFSITDDADPIEVGSEATYEIVISNRGSRDDSNVKLQMLLPPGLELVASEAEASTDDRGLIAFAPTMTLAAGKDVVHRIRVRGVAPGTHIVKAIASSTQASVPVTKEESTMVYADQ